MARRRAITSAKGRLRRAAENGYGQGTISICPPSQPAPPTVAVPCALPHFDHDLEQFAADLAGPLARIAALKPRQSASLNLADYTPAEGERIVAAYRGVALNWRPISPAMIQAMHRQLTEGLPPRQGTTNVPGMLRRHECELRLESGGPIVHKPPPACEVPRLVAHLCDWVNHRGPGFLVAVLAHLGLSTAHIFGDGNGRVSRLVEFALLVQGGIPPSAAIDLHNAWLGSRQEYSDVLQTARGGDLRPLVRFAAEGVLGGRA